MAAALTDGIVESLETAGGLASASVRTAVGKAAMAVQAAQLVKPEPLVKVASLDRVAAPDKAEYLAKVVTRAQQATGVTPHRVARLGRPWRQTGLTRGHQDPVAVTTASYLVSLVTKAHKAAPMAGRPVAVITS